MRGAPERQVAMNGLRKVSPILRIGDALFADAVRLDRQRKDAETAEAVCLMARMSPFCRRHAATPLYTIRNTLHI